jgi:hypothetical protein
MEGKYKYNGSTYGDHDLKKLMKDNEFNLYSFGKSTRANREYCKYILEGIPSQNENRLNVGTFLFRKMSKDSFREYITTIKDTKLYLERFSFVLSYLDIEEINYIQIIAFVDEDNVIKFYYEKKIFDQINILLDFLMNTNIYFNFDTKANPLKQVNSDIAKRRIDLIKKLNLI